MDFVNKVEQLFPDKSQIFQRLGALYENKLWHQLSVELVNLLKDSSFEIGDNFLSLYTDFIVQFEEKLNGIQLAVLISLIGGKLNNGSAELNLYQLVLNTQRKQDEETRLSVELCVAYVLLTLSRVEEAVAILDKAKQILQNGSISSSHVYSRYYKALSELYQIEEKHTEFYSAALLYLSYSTIDDFSIMEKRNLAKRVALSSVLSETVFDFAVFLQSPLLSYLNEDQLWLSNLVHIMNEGNVRGLKILVADKSLENFPLAISKWPQIQAKVVHLAVLNLILSLNPHDRNISFITLSEACQISLEEVESVVMKLMSKGLMRGRIDEVSQVVNVDWIQPRELDKVSVSSVHNQLLQWSER
mmetsp:Transcript_11883/g.12807  ORF Transcript_11883/g.12807 Transcript_11883/m.12807 type:complete len:359 (-) Transcript_11883:935-2011(-)